MRVKINKARVHVTGHFHAEGSVLGQTVEGRCDGFETRVEVEADEAPEQRGRGSLQRGKWVFYYANHLVSSPCAHCSDVEWPPL